MTFLADLLSTVFERRYRWPSLDQDDDRPIETLTEGVMVSFFHDLSKVARSYQRFAAARERNSASSNVRSLPTSAEKAAARSLVHG